MGVVGRRRDFDWWGGRSEQHIGSAAGWLWLAGRELDGVVKCEADCSIIDVIKYAVGSRVFADTEFLRLLSKIRGKETKKRHIR